MSRRTTWWAILVMAVTLSLFSEPALAQSQTTATGAGGVLGRRRIPARLDHGADLDRRHDEGLRRLNPAQERGRRQGGIGAFLRDALRDGSRRGRVARGGAHRLRRLLRRPGVEDGEADAPGEARHRLEALPGLEERLDQRQRPLRYRLRGPLHPARPEREEEAGGVKLEPAVAFCPVGAALAAARLS